MSAELPGTPASLTPAALPFVQLFTDGACQGNPGPGGWGYILRHPATGKEKEASGGMALTTNNQMEMQAVIEGLKALSKRSRVEVITDSSYVAKGSREWMPAWKANGWRRREGKSWKPVKNVELWKQLDELLSGHVVSFTLVKGHAGHPENERCDEMAVAAAMRMRKANAEGTLHANQAPQMVSSETDNPAKECLYCNGTGKVLNKNCVECKGTGKQQPPSEEAFDKYAKTSPPPGHIYKDDADGNRVWK